MLPSSHVPGRHAELSAQAFHHLLMLPSVICCIASYSPSFSLVSSTAAPALMADMRMMVFASNIFIVGLDQAQRY